MYELNNAESKSYVKTISLIKYRRAWFCAIFWKLIYIKSNKKNHNFIIVAEKSAILIT